MFNIHGYVFTFPPFLTRGPVPGLVGFLLTSAALADLSGHLSVFPPALL